MAGAHPGAEADAPHPDLRDADAGKLVDPELDARERDDSQSGDSQSAVLASPAEPCKPDADPFAEQSFAAQAPAGVQVHSAGPLPDAVAEPVLRRAHLLRERLAQLERRRSLAGEALPGSLPLAAEVRSAWLQPELAAVQWELPAGGQVDVELQLSPE